MTEPDPGRAESWELANRYDGVLTVSPEPENHYEWDWGHRTCYTYCRRPGRIRRSGRVRQRPGERCPHCFGPTTVRDVDAHDIDPEPSRMSLFAAWAGGWVTAFTAAVVSPFYRPETAEAEREELIEAAARGDHE